MTRKQLAREVSGLAQIDLKQAYTIVQAVFMAIAKGLQNKENVYVRGFGTFKLVYLPPRKFGPNIKKHKISGLLTTSPRYKVHFKPAVAIKARLYYDYKGPHDHPTS